MKTAKETKSLGTFESERSGRPQWNHLVPVPWTSDTAPDGTHDTCAGEGLHWYMTHPAGRAPQTASASSLCLHLSGLTGQLRQGKEEKWLVVTGINEIQQITWFFWGQILILTRATPLCTAWACAHKFILDRKGAEGAKRLPLEAKDHGEFMGCMPV